MTSADYITKQEPITSQSRSQSQTMMCNLSRWIRCLQKCTWLLDQSNLSFSNLMQVMMSSLQLCPTWWRPHLLEVLIRLVAVCQLMNQLESRLQPSRITGFIPVKKILKTLLSVIQTNERCRKFNMNFHLKIILMISLFWPAELHVTFVLRGAPHERSLKVIESFYRVHTRTKIWRSTFSLNVSHFNTSCKALFINNVYSSVRKQWHVSSHSLHINLSWTECLCAGGISSVDSDGTWTTGDQIWCSQESCVYWDPELQFKSTEMCLCSLNRL